MSIGGPDPDDFGPYGEDLFGYSESTDELYQHGAFTRAKLRELAMVPMPLPPRQRVEPLLLGFRNLNPSAGDWGFQAQPAVPFRILGLLVWGVTKETVITSFRIGSSQQLAASDEPVPARFFASGLSFSELVASAVDDEGKPLTLSVGPSGREEPPESFWGWCKEHPNVDPRQLLSMDTVSLGVPLAVWCKGPIHQLVVWGLGLRGGP